MREMSTSEPRPRALLLATQPWPVSAKLGLALRACGFSISLWSPKSNFLLRTHAAERHYPYRPLYPDAMLQHALETEQPALIVPCDEPAMAVLQRIAARALATPGSASLRATLERSFGPLENLARVTQRSLVLQAAAEGGAAVTAYAPVATPEELRAWLSIHGFPAYLKTDGSFGARGVLRVQDYEEADAAFAALEAPPSLSIATRRLACDRDPSLLTPALHRRRGVISVQRAAMGHDANSAIFCWRGRVLASISMEVMAVTCECGPSTVLRRIQNPAMDRTAEILARAFHLSGFFGLDFILDAQTDTQTGTPWLLEMNARATQIPHLALGEGSDLPAAAYGAVTGQPVIARPAITDKQVIALFPQEWHRDPRSPLLHSAHHDVPWESPTLIAALMDQRPPLVQRLTRIYPRGRRPRPQAAAPLPTGEPLSNP